MIGANRRVAHTAAQFTSAPLRFVMAFVALSAALGQTAHAHPLAPALLELLELPDRRFEMRWKVSLLTPAGAEVRPALPPHCQTVGEPTSKRDAASVTTTIRVDCGEQGLVGATLGVMGLDDSRTDALVRVVMLDGRRLRSVLNGADASFVVPEGDQALVVAGDYLLLGFEHIMTGFDHLAFVLGLILLVAGAKARDPSKRTNELLSPRHAAGGRSILVTVTAFTLGHSVTLSLATLGFVDFPSRPIEFAIAFSIFLLAVELSRGPDREPTLLGRRPWLMAGSFGLLHGFGFAGALTEVGLPAGEIPLALVSFNVGIEIGQLLFVAFVLVLQFGFAPLMQRLPERIEMLPTYGIGSMAVYWCFERAAGI